MHLRRTDENVREIDALGTLLGGRGRGRRGARRPQPTGVAHVRARARPARAGRSTGASPGTARTAATSAGGRRACPPRPTPPTPRTSAASTCSPSAGTPRTRAASGSRSSTWPACGTATCCWSCRSSTSTAMLVLRPLRVHAGGIVWNGPYLHVAATARGLVTCRVDDIMRVPDVRGTGAYRLGLRGPAGGVVRLSLRAARAVLLPGVRRRRARPAEVLLPLARPQHRTAGDRRGRVRADRADAPGWRATTSSRTP